MALGGEVARLKRTPLGRPSHDGRWNEIALVAAAMPVGLVGLNRKNPSVRERMEGDNRKDASGCQRCRSDK